MTITIQLSDEEAAAFQKRAAEEGLSVEAWLQKLAHQFAEPPGSAAIERDDRPIWEIASRMMDGLPEEVLQRLPVDGASEHDHYIYGTPKRNK